jgi:7-keto-8-aminopelargonate synthetase-like enzyme
MEYLIISRRYEKSRFDIIDGDSAIVPVMLYDAKLSQNMADELLKKRHICNRFLLSGGP